jgi:hypothetical protein
MKKKNRFSVCILGITLAVFFSHSLPGMEKITKDKILKSDQEWEDIYAQYMVDLSLLGVLKEKLGDGLKIDVYLGLWCSDSKNNVPVFMKIIDALGEDNLPVNYYTVERKASKDVKYYVEDLKVERVPTFIFYRNGQEIGRIVENPQKSIIEDFIEIIF